MYNLIVGLKIKSYRSFAVVAKIIKEYQEYSYSDIKSKINNNELVLCYDCADRFGVKKIISCYEKLVANDVEVILFELDNRETSIEQLKIRSKTYDEISDEIDSDDDN